MNEPKSLYKNDSLTWTESLSDYPASTWTLKYKFTGLGNVTVTATPSGEDHLVTITQAISNKLNEGIYRLVGWVEKSGEKKTVYDAVVEVKPDYASIPGGYNALSVARTTLQNIETAIQNYSANPYQSLTIKGKTKTNWSMTELLVWRGKLLAEVKREEDALRVASGLKSNRRIFTRFEPTGQ